jgi:hypothetical protein
MAPTGPTAAERVRTACARVAAALIVTDGAVPADCPLQHVLPDGTVALTVSRLSPIAAAPPGTSAVVELLDHATTEAEAVRALVWIRGRIRPTAPDQLRTVLDLIASVNPDPALLDVGSDATLLILTVDSIVFADSAGAEAVSLAAFRHAQPDPFCRVESVWLHHLHHHHPEMINRLRLHLPRCLRRGRLQLIGLDRYGLAVRVAGPQQHWDRRIPFHAPVNDDAGLSRALRSLMHCPFAGGLTSRTNQRSG